MRYAVVIEKGESSYGAYVPDLPGCVAVGDTEDEAKQLIQEAIEFHLEGMREENLPIPEAETAVDTVYVDATPSPKNPTSFLNPITKTQFRNGMRLIEAGDILEGEGTLRAAISADPFVIKAVHNSVLAALKRSGDPLNYISMFRFVLRLDPTYDLARRNLAISYINYGVQQANNHVVVLALDVFFRALRLGPPHDISALAKANICAAFTEMARQAHSEGDINGAVALMARAYESSPSESSRQNLAMAYASAAMRFMDEEKLQQAIEAFEGAVDAGINIPAVLNDYAVVLARLERIPEAVGILERAKEISPDNETIISNLNSLTSSNPNETEAIGQATPFEFYQPSAMKMDPIAT